MNILKMADAPPATVGESATVLEAVELMVRKRVGAVAVAKDERLLGIFTERDVMLRVVMARRDPARTSMAEVMTSDVVSAGIEMTAGEALALMIERHFRHLPILDAAGRVLGMLSIRNLLESRVDDLTRELDSLEVYLTADGPGG